MDIVFKTRKFVIEHDLVEAGDHVLVAVSGGIDSMTLLHVLLNLRDELGLLLSVIHVNHKLRGKDSDKDEKFVKGFSDQNGLPFHAIHWKGALEGENLQEAARNFRYGSFLKVAKKIGAGKIALAHNMEDQAETMLLNIIRGAGLDGICGMSFKRVFDNEIFLIRPLLGISREEIKKFSREGKILYRDDVTNDQFKYSRNFIRLKVMPLIQKINPSASESMAAMAGLLQTDEEYIHNEASRLFDEAAQEEKNGFVIDGEKFRGFHPSIRTRILRLAYIRLTGGVAGITKDHLLKMDEVAMGSKREGAYNLPKSLIFERKGTRLAILRK